MSRDDIPRPQAQPAADAHARTWALIPWLVNGRADHAQRAAAERHLAGCADCRAELQAQQRLRQGLQAALPAPAAELDAERGLQRLLGRLDQLPVAQDLPDALLAAPGRSPGPASAAPAPAPACASTSGSAPESASSPAALSRARRARLPMALAAAVVLQAVGLVVLSLQLPRSDDAPFRTLSQPAAAAPVEARYRVVPDPAWPLQRWQALLDETQLRVVDGPNAVGAYALAPRSAQSVAPSAQVLARLRAAPGMRLAEALGPVP